MASSPKRESYTFYTKPTWRRKLVAWSMLLLYMTQPIIASAEVVADPKAPVSKTPIVQTTANGLPVVQIAGPSVAGVSHNLYQNFNVDPKGLILNNSKLITQTQLAGYITGNPNLVNGPARIILNEVTSNNPSYLRGYTEVAGQRAEVIIANPNGIYGDGFGFINTSRAVLTTGTPVFGGSGSLDAFRVTGGQISIQGAGMNTSDVDQVDLISRSVAVNAGVWAKNLNVVAGSNQVNYNTLHTDIISGDTNTPQVAVDVGQLGGMYAQKIYLVGTENGVGVNSKGTIAAQAGDVTITSAGKVLLAGSTSATGNIQVAAVGDVTNQNTLYAQGNTNITTQGNLQNSGTLVAGQNTTLSAQSITSTGTLGAGVKTDGTLGTAGDLTLHANGTISAQGKNMAAGNLTVNGAEINLASSQTYTGGNANITSTTGDINHNSGTMQVGGTLNMNAQGVIRNDNGTINAGKVTLNGGSISNKSGNLSQIGQETTTISAVNSIDNTTGTISTNGDSLTMQANSLLNSQGQIQHAGAGTLSVQTAGDISNNAGKLATNGQLKLTTHSIDNTQGTIVGKGITLNAQGTLVNDSGTIASSGDAVRIDVQGTLSNKQGSIEANNGLEVTAQSVDNQKGRLVSLDTSGLKVTATQDIQNQSGLIGGNGDINLTAQSLVNTSGKVIAQGNVNGDISQTIDNSNGNIQAQQNVTLGQLGTNVSNTQQGNISAGTNLAIKANTFNNTDGSLVAKQDIGIQAGDITAGGTILAGQDVNLTVTNHLTQGTGGNLKANRDINIIADTVLNQGSIAAVRDINLKVKDVTNSSGSSLVGNENLTVTAAGDVANSGKMAGSTTTIAAKNITNSGSIFADHLNVKADTLSNAGNTAVITANQSAAINANKVLHNTNGATMYMGNKDATLTINTLALDNSGLIASNGNLAVEAQTIQSSGTLGAGVQSDGTLGTSGNLVLQASGNVIATGKNLAAGTIDVTAQDINLTGAKTGAGKDINLTATTGDINNTGAVMQAAGAITLQTANALRNDKDTAGNVANLQGNAITINAKSISNIGSNITQFGTADTNITAATTLDNTGGSIVTNGTNLTIKADTVTGSQSKIIHAGTGKLDITATTSMSNTNASSIQTNGNVTIKAGELDNTKGTITALQGIAVTGNTLTNQQGVLATSKEVSITLQNGLNNQKGIVEAGKGLSIQAQSIDNNSGSISSLDASGMTVTAAQGIDNTAGRIGGNGDVNLTAQSLNNTTGKVLSQGSINADISQIINNTSGTMAARQNVTIGRTGTNIVNATQGSITAGGNLTAQANTLSNTGGTMAANTDVAVTATTINGTGNVTAGQDVTLTVNGDFINSADSNVKANRDVNLTAANVTNLGNLAAVGNLNINANNITNQTNANLQGGTALTIVATGDINNSGTMEGNTATISAKNITNTGSVFGDNITMTADTISNHDNAAVIAATKNINLYAKTSLENKDDATIYSMGNINIAGSKNQDVNGEYMDKTSSILNQSATIEADGNIGIYADTLTNKMREYEKKETVVSETKYGSDVTMQANDGYNYEYGNNNYYFISDFTSTGSASAVKQIGGKIWTGSNWGQFNGEDFTIIGVMAETVTEASIIPKSSIGKIMSGANMKLRIGTINNDMAWILANGTLNQVGTVNNTAVGNTRITTQHLVHADKLYVYVSEGEGAGVNINRYLENYFPIDNAYKSYSAGFAGKSYYETTTEQIPGGTSSLFGGGQQVTIQGNVNNTTVAATNIPVNTVNNITSSGSTLGTDTVKNNNTNDHTTAIQPTSGINAVTTSSVPTNNLQTLLPSGKTPVVPVKQTVDDSKFTVPTNGMFTTHQEPNSKYLVETNPRFASYGSFISSDYVLKQLGVDPANTMKRLGDGFYEEKLVREQVSDLTGRYYLNNYSSSEQQYKALMDNGVTYAKQFNLQVGVALTSEQMNQLTSDMVWMVEKEVNGQKVLVPEVYLSKAGNIDLKANGAVISANKVTIENSDYVNNAGMIKATEGVDIHAVDIANYGGTIDGGKSTTLNAMQDLVNIGGKIKGDKIDLTAGNDFKNETISFTSTLPFMTKTTVGNIASINAGDSLTINAKNVSITGAEVNATKDVTINAKGNIVVDSIQERDRLAAGKQLDDTVSNVVSSIKAGNNVSITSTGDTTLKGAQITADNALDLTAGGNINITAVKDETIHDKTVDISHGWKRTRTDDETVIGSTLQGGNEVTIKTTTTLPDGTKVADSDNRGNITISGSTIRIADDKETKADDSDMRLVGARADDSDMHPKGNAIATEDKKNPTVENQVTSTTSSKNKTVTISADKNVTIENVTEKHESLVVSHTQKSGFLSSTTKDTMDHALINEVKGSTISGDTVAITSGNDLTVKGSNVVGTNDVTLDAAKDVNITSAAETGIDDHYSYTKKSGLFSGGGLGFTVGSQSTKTTTNEQTLDQVGSTIGSIDGNVTIKAGNKVDSAGTTLIAGKDLNITGKDVTIDNTINTVDSQSKYEFKQSGLTISLGGGIVDTGISAYNNLERSGQVEDDRLKALYDYKAAQDIKKLADSKGNLKANVGINVSIGSSQMTSEQTSHTETVNTSNMNAGDNVTIKATEGDVNLKGTKINAEDIKLDAAKDINIDSAENKNQTTSKTSSSSVSVGGTIGVGFNASTSKGSSNEKENIMTNTGSVINASGTLTLNSGKDTNIIGSQVSGDNVVADIKGDLNIASKQDTDDYTAKNKNIGIGVSGGPKGGTTGSINQGKTDSTYASVTEQAGIFAGKDGFNITVGKNTDLKGAVISSDATPDKNKISTDTLTYSDIQNKAEYSSSSIGANYDSRPTSKYNEHGLTPNVGIPSSGDASSTTKSAISPGTIEIRSNPNQDISGLSRDTINSLNTLGKIFDKQTVKERQELAGLFGEIAFEEIHKISEKNGWNDGDPQKVALHALVGGIMSQLTGNGFGSGAVGAGFSEFIQKELSNITDPALRQWASYIISTATTGTVGGVTALYGTKYNDVLTVPRAIASAFLLARMGQEALTQLLLKYGVEKITQLSAEAYVKFIVEAHTIINSIKFRVGDNGYFGDEGQSGSSRVRNMTGGNEAAQEFFNYITQGCEDTEVIYPNGATVRTLQDGTKVTYREVSKSEDGSPAVDINAGTTYKSQKIHFVD
ncbi:hemagglutinin repeat-containing protein [Pelosinus sp. IPA-1]|uniref:two-partner secretion domain-containing protein n=1 Tax=Pelosinus sp. IPA-1 TaxID=3029569 RepID=UPI0024362459|nr:hemagglutinin repeat-containing protein [Pelosinus sp. IPA-1]GMA99536.1 hypothetical protein PIPA1_23360 [Pelosinus sp. IPA-1]